MSLTTLTFGCRLNAAESVAIGARAEAAGVSDAIVVNTCAVTGEAVRQARQAIRKARREHPEKRIVVTGCAAQTDPKMFAAMPEVDLVLGNAEKLSPEAWGTLVADGSWRSNNFPHAEALHSAPSRLAQPVLGPAEGRTRGLAPQDEGGMEPRSTRRHLPRPPSTVLRGNADCVGIAPQYEGLQGPRPHSGEAEARSTQPNINVVMPGLDPGIHSVTVESIPGANGMDCRVKPGNDDSGRMHPVTGGVQPYLPHAEVLHSAPSRLAQPVLGPAEGRTRGLAPQDEGGMEPRSTQGTPASRLFGIAASEKIRVSDIFSVRETAAHMLDGFGERHRAFVQIQNGCDHRCTFCIIPYGRGNSRSVPAGAIVDEIRRLAARGFGEVVLTGVDITAWGADLPGRPRLGMLVRKILKLVPELPRVRLSSIDSVEADDELLRALAEEERLMPHLHLSLQSGDDMILKRMKRRHLRADAIRFAERVRKLRPDVVFGADLIAGFPTETDAMFENSVRLVEECGLALLHVFPFSPRKGTPAAKMPQLPKEVVRSRAKILREKGEAALTGFMSGEIGKIRSVLVEKDGFGRSEHYMPVSVSGGEPGKILSARIVGSRANMLAGEAIREAA